MLGAILGDVVGSRFEWRNCKSKQFDFLTSESRLTDDSVMTLAIARAIVLWRRNPRCCVGTFAVETMQELGRKYADIGYGPAFAHWLSLEHPRPYCSWGNGAAMRVSPCAFAARTLDEALGMARAVTHVTHNHPEGLKGAEATTAAIFLARMGEGKDEIRAYIENHYYPLDFTLDEIRPAYAFDVSCQGSVPPAIVAFLESTDYEDAIRNAVSIGGDSDTIAAITGGIAEAHYGLTDLQRTQALVRLPSDLRAIVQEFEALVKTEGAVA